MIDFIVWCWKLQLSLVAICLPALIVANIINMITTRGKRG